MSSPTSQISIGFPETAKNVSSASGTPRKISPKALPLTPVVVPKQTSITNACCLVFYCAQHKRIAIRKYPKRGYFLPNVTFRPFDPWEKVINYAINSLRNRLPKVEPAIQLTNELLDVMRFQLAKTRTFSTRLTVLVRIDTDHKSPNNENKEGKAHVGTVGDISSESLVSYQSKERLLLRVKENEQQQQQHSCWCYLTLPGGNHVLWMNKDQLNTTLSNKFSGPEALLFYSLLENETPSIEVKKTVSSFSIFDALHFFKKKYIGSPERKLLTEAKYSPKAILFLFNEFVLHCFPSRHMTFLSFKNFLRQRLNWASIEESVAQMLFRALNIRDSNFLTFNELLLGLAAMDTETPHREVIETRLRYIFRFYDADLDSRLNMTEICQLINDIVLKNKDTELVRLSKPEEVANRLNEHFADHFIQSQLDKALGMTLEEFSKISLKNRTFCELAANIFRAPFSILGYILVHFNYQDEKDELSDSAPQTIVRHLIYNHECRTCKATKFSIAGQCVCFVAKREELEVLNLESMHQANKDKNKDTLPSNLRADVLLPSSETWMIVLDLLIRLRQFGLAKFRLPMTMRRATATNDEDIENNLGQWYFRTKEKQLEAVKTVLQLVKKVLTNEDKLVTVISPAYVVGQLHGNFKECMSLSAILWRHVPFLTPASGVILGNFVSGPYGLEVTLYLLCLKILAPKRVVVLRGIEEVRVTQKKKESTFQEQCNKLDPAIWEMINEVFDRLPVSCVVDEKIFCTSSGYPIDIRVDVPCFKYIVPNVLSNPLELEPILQILSLDNTRLDNDGGQPLQRFLTSNQLSHVIRSHACDPSLSEQYKDNQRLISLYSAAKLSDENRTQTKALSTFALIAHNVIRLIRLDSTNITPTLPKTKDADRAQQAKGNATPSKRHAKQPPQISPLSNEKTSNN